MDTPLSRKIRDSPIYKPSAHALHCAFDAFDFDKSDIRQGDAKILDANADWLKSHPINSC